MRTWLMVPALTASLLAMVLLAGAAPALARGGGMPPSPVVLGEIVEKEVKQSRSFVGTVEPVRTGHVDVQASGFVETLTVEVGDHVDFDDTIATLRTKTLDIRIEAAQAELELRKKALLELENGSRPEDKERARARLREAKADEQTAEWKLQAVEKLRKDKRASEEELRDAQRAVATALARRQALESALALVEAGPRAERIAQAKASVAVQQAEVDRLDDEKKRHTIKAPFTGYVVTKNTEVGSWVDTGEPVVQLVALDEVDVVVPVLEDAVSHLKRGMKVNVAIDALPEPYITGEIFRIVPVADRRTRTVPVKVRVKNVIKDKQPLIKAGMFARCWLAVGKPRKTLLVPKDAIVLGGRSPVVFVFDGKDTAAPVPVELGVAVDDLIEVVGPLKAGAQVVTKGNERIFPGTKVRPIGQR
ncbi:MAG: efflux RND transporter periplasmic adaptor subunit [Planctomycetota bacterium]|nr:efflux RND transporter periplasmic adaptor subunit [Planctomycetota bacterium]